MGIYSPIQHDLLADGEIPIYRREYRGRHAGPAPGDDEHSDDRDGESGGVDGKHRQWLDGFVGEGGVAGAGGKRAGAGQRRVGRAGIGGSSHEKEVRQEVVGLLVESGRGQAGRDRERERESPRVSGQPTPRDAVDRMGRGHCAGA